MTKLIVENKVPFISELVEPLFDEVIYMSDAEMTPDSVRDADAIIGRTRTRCGSALLTGSRCRFCATATIGLDHFETGWLKANGITYANAPGCNKPAVAQWVCAAILRLCPSPEGLTLGIVGVGNIGSLVAKWARGLGMNVLLNDPPRAEAEGADGFVSLDEIARRADIVTFHTPLTREGAHPSYHLGDAEFFSSLERKPVILNASRGAVVDNEALCDALDAGQVRAAAIDTWEGEPKISRRLLEKTAIATPHIAGYSIEGKHRATYMVVEALRRHLGLEPGDASARVRPIPESVTAEAVRASYDIMADDALLRNDPEAFETTRDTYALRHEI